MSLHLPSTPSQLGFRMPAEWEPQRAVWLAWPHKEESWPGAFEPIPAVFARLAAELSTDQVVEILVPHAELGAKARALIAQAGGNLSNVRLREIATNDSWIRDFGPTFLVRTPKEKQPDAPNGSRALVGWRYNAWGGKYPPWERDEQVPRRLAAMLDLPLFEPGIVLEGGSIDVNGQGLLLTTEQCLLNPNRNPHLSKQEIEDHLRAYLGVQQIIWLGEGIEGDDTDGHIDDLSRFVAADTVVTIVEDDPADVHYERLRENLGRLREARDQAGRPLRVISLPVPEPVIYEGQRLPASYANFYIGNRKVIVPTFGTPRDAQALDALQGLFADRKIVGINARELVWGLGAFHCVTQQEPRAH